MTGVKKNFLKLTLDKSHFITEGLMVAGEIGEKTGIDTKIACIYNKDKEKW